MSNTRVMWAIRKQDDAPITQLHALRPNRESAFLDACPLLRTHYCSEEGCGDRVKELGYIVVRVEVTMKEVPL